MPKRDPAVPRQNSGVFWLVLSALLASGIARPNWAIRLNGFTLDEPGISIKN